MSNETEQENAKMKELLERYQVHGIQVSGDSTHWRRYLSNETDEQFLKEGEDGRVSNAGHDLSDSCADSRYIDNSVSVITDVTYSPTPLKPLRLTRHYGMKCVDSDNATAIEQHSAEIVAAIAGMQEQIDDLRDAERSGFSIDNSLTKRIEKLEKEYDAMLSGLQQTAEADHKRVEALEAREEKSSSNQESSGQGTQLRAHARERR